MATVIERERPVSRSERYVEVDRSDSSGWVVAIVLLVLLALGVVWWLRYRAPATYSTTPAASPANINVTVPGTSGGGSNSSGGANPGGGTGTNGSGAGGAGTGATGGTGTTY